MTLSSSGPTDMDRSKMAPAGSVKETVASSPKVMFSLGRNLVLVRDQTSLGSLSSLRHPSRR